MNWPILNNNNSGFTFVNIKEYMQKAILFPAYEKMTTENSSRIEISKQITQKAQDMENIMMLDNVLTQ